VGVTPPVDETAIDGWTLVWNDEFDTGTVPSPDKWSFDVGGSGWGNNELQYYTQYRKENARIENGKLVIEARKEDFEGKKYTSARMVTANKGDWVYGRIDVRAKLPSGYGTWPAIWMLSTDWEYGGWPASGEIDIMEHVGKDQDVIHGSTHSQKYYFKIGTQKTKTIRIPDVSTTFHTYGLEWYADHMDMFVDGVKYFTSTNDGTGWEAWPFNKRFHLLLNLAIGGNWGGSVDDSIFPQRMEVEYVRVYAKNK
ncbi:MAG TPA: glycoside hydrolase family 16 protein, partial [Bacteroidota bacterium]|nr:glycoside hydrolase family 16 protein [Bacteroidota bacterium]